MSRRAKRPLNEDAVAKANEEVYKELGERRKLDPNSKADEDFRKLWMDAYVAAGGELEGNQPHPKPPSEPVAPCPLCEFAYLVVMVTDYDGKPIENAIVNVVGIGPSRTDANGLANYGEVNPDSYNISAGKEGYWSAPDRPDGLAEVVKSVVPYSIVVANLKLYLINEPVMPFEEKPGITIRVSLFFDGTFNNRDNTMRGGQSDPPTDTSYKNDYSNVVKLFNLIRKPNDIDYFEKIYLEGVGTTNLGDDSLLAAGTGYGIGSSTGVIQQVERALNQLIELITKISRQSGSKNFKYLHLDVFGFSRGSTAARYFIYAALEQSELRLKERLEARGFSVKEIEFIFGGLFDTVASFGVDHSNDTANLRLDAIRHVKQVVHLCAGEEHRENFSLTDITSSLRAGKGKQFFLPGVHSDVGGGYAEIENEDKILCRTPSIPQFLSDNLGEIKVKKERKELINFGWYEESQLEIKEIPFREYLLFAKREVILNKYSLIPLHIMMEYAIKANLIFWPAEDVPEDLKDAKEKIWDYVIGMDVNNGVSEPYHWSVNNSEWLKKLRHKYLHFSASYDKKIAIISNVHLDPIQRKGLSDSLDPNPPHYSNNDRINGSRVRVIHPG